MKNIIDIVFLFFVKCFARFSKRNNVIAIFYHGVSEGEEPLCIRLNIFKEQIEYLIAKKYHFATSDEIVKYIKGELDLPNRSVHISFDDGFENIYTNAFQYLRERSVPFTIFLNTGFVDKELYHKEAFCLAPKENRNEKCQFLSTDQVVKMQEIGVEFQNHTHTHINLLGDKTLDEKVKDLNKCHETLLDKFKINSQHFSYPFGFINEEIQKYLKKINYIAGWGIDECLINHDTDVFDIPRAPITNMSLVRFKIIVSNQNHLYKKMSSVMKNIVK